MTTPEGPPHGSPGEQDADRPAWGRPPAGGWGGAAPDPAEQTRSWSESGADPDATRVEQPGVWGGAPRPDAPHPGAPQSGASQSGAPQPGAPAWAQQPPPAGGWNAPPGGYPPQPYGQQPYPQPPHPGGQQPYSGGQQSFPGGQPFPGGQQQYPGGRPPPWGGQPGPQWGPGYPPLPDVTRPPRRSRLPLIIGAVVALLLGVGAILAFVTPGFLNRTVFDQAALQGGVQRVLTDSYGYPAVGEVLCGDPAQGPIRVVEGDTFTCTTTIDGAPATVPVRITSSTGDYEVSRPPT